MFNLIKKVAMENLKPKPIDSIVNQGQANEVVNRRMYVGLYRDFIKRIQNIPLLEIFEEIKTGVYKDDVEYLRVTKQMGNDDLANSIKNKLLAFTASGTFCPPRSKDTIETYSQVICLDFDNVPETELEELKGSVNRCPFTLASFISPSGLGLKVFTLVDSNADVHTEMYTQVANYYKEHTGFEYDSKCKDITRLCFVSYDPELFYNEDAEVFSTEEDSQPSILGVREERFHNSSSYERLNECLKFTKKKEQYYNGNRNNFICLLANNANRWGIPIADTLNFCTTNFDLGEKEIKATVESVYRNNFGDFASFAKFAKVQSLESKTESPEAVEDFIKLTPFIPQSVYDNLPPTLFECCKAFSDLRERDVFLTGALAIISGCLPNVSGVYSGSKVYPNLFSFILAPAASGKGALKFAKVLADKYHAKTLAKSVQDKKDYDVKMAASKKGSRKTNLTFIGGLPKEPKFKVVYIPANTSNAKVIYHLEHNDGRGIMCETEADTLGQTFKNEWGAYSDMMRKAFHHETISVSRKTDSEFIEVNEPKLSVALSGTPKQVFGIINSAEDGLFSRFIFYVFKTESIWLDPSPKGNPINLTSFFNNQSQRILEMVEFFEDEEMAFHLTDEQWEELNTEFKTFLEQVNTFVSEDALSVVKRLGLILYRFCMIFSALRKFENNSRNKEIYCSDVDFKTALALTKVYLEHSLMMFNNLPKQGEQGVFKSSKNKQMFFDALPDSFQRKEAVELGETFGMKVRSVDAFLQTCVGKYLEQPKSGFYKKM
jgi:Protein of unknown function (DUF3987)/VirE N-terminal domain